MCEANQCEKHSPPSQFRGHQRPPGMHQDLIECASYRHLGCDGHHFFETSTCAATANRLFKRRDASVYDRPIRLNANGRCVLRAFRLGSGPSSSENPRSPARSESRPLAVNSPSSPNQYALQNAVGTGAQAEAANSGPCRASVRHLLTANRAR